MTDPNDLAGLTKAIEQLTAALTQAKPDPRGTLALPQVGNRFVWRDGALAPVMGTAIGLELLLGIDRQKERLVANLSQFAQGLPANHVMLWGAPGTGKSALAKAAFAALLKDHPSLAMVEVPRDALGQVGPLLASLDQGDRSALVFIDDLSFGASDQAYRTLKTVLDGGLAARPGLGKVLVIVTSNLRHLIDRDATKPSASQRPDEAAFEQLALSDRFGLWLGFHPMDQETYLAIVRAYCDRFGLKPGDKGLDRAALQWAQMRGTRSGRAAWQFIMDRAGQMGASISL